MISTRKSVASRCRAGQDYPRISPNSGLSQWIYSQGFVENRTWVISSNSSSSSSGYICHQYVMWWWWRWLWQHGITVGVVNVYPSIRTCCRWLDRRILSRIYINLGLAPIAHTELYGKCWMLMKILAGKGGETGRDTSLMAKRCFVLITRINSNIESNADSINGFEVLLLTSPCNK